MSMKRNDIDTEDPMIGALRPMTRTTEHSVAMTEKHNAVLSWQAYGGIAPMPLHECERLNEEIAANIRSQVSGESVNVPRSELETHCGELYAIHAACEPGKIAGRLWDRWLTVRGWLSSSRTSEGTDR